MACPYSGAAKRVRPRRESNPHLRFRKPLFYPLNYGNNDLERINGLNEDGQGHPCAAGRFLEGRALRSTLRSLLESILARAFPCECIWLPRLKKKLSWKSRMCCSRTSSVTPSCQSISNER